jgi:hexulose-6-phosphate isomerase
MQGRLSARPAGKLQAFPHASWQEEFSTAARLGFDAIEWIFEAERASENPVSSAAGRAEIKRVVSETGVAVRSLCADYFMVHRLAGDGEERVQANLRVLCNLIELGAELGAERILLPLLETAAVDTPQLREEVARSLRSVAPLAASSGVTLGLEMEIPGEQYAALIQDVGHPAVRAYYDTGNSTAQGYDIALDIAPLLSSLFAVHVKDRKRHGTSVRLGTGDCNFDGFLRAITASGFSGDFVLQHYFEDDPEGTARAALGFLRERLTLAKEVAA